MNDNQNNKETTIQISAGRGPAECCWVVAQVLKLLLLEARQLGLTATVIAREAGPENATLYSAAVMLSGAQVEAFLEGWEGSLLWIGKSTYRKYHKRKNWYVGVKRLELPHTAASLKEGDIRYEATRTGGPGGQHVNKVSTAIRAMHLPSGISVLASESRSQLQNKKAARKRLENHIAEMQLKQQQETIRHGWQQHLELERANPVRTFCGSDFKLHHQPEEQRALRPAQKGTRERTVYEKH